MARLSIVIPNYWANEDLVAMTREAIARIRAHTETSYGIVLIDDGSPLHPEFGELCLRLEKHSGFAKAVNKGLLSSAAEFFCVMNNDTFVTAGWDVQLVEQAMDEEVGFAFPDCRAFSDRDHEAKRRFGGRAVDCDLRGAFGACFVSRYVIYDRIGMLDEGYGFGGWEDKDLFARAIETGYVLRKCFGSIVHHKGNATANGVSGFWQGQRENRKRFEVAHGPISKWRLEG